MAKGLLSENRPIPTDSPIYDFHLLAYLSCFYAGEASFIGDTSFLNVCRTIFDADYRMEMLLRYEMLQS